ncbi:GGDEF domain-containing protein [Vibrio hippocampi]|uniref:diguanylate cyclase n=1 Tax=Vibrio hippocampi TaxID=654686 RepID=A0ABM8ZL51_9VIBR|nr:sensor domain-containing diguanylate cyclase [Vibrio hippocampi]CAH0528978.1 hypothetical protein VHP8226_02989 [Vibrio hippocampi]
MQIPFLRIVIIASKAAIISLILYSVMLYQWRDQLVKSEVTKFNLVTSSLEEHKSSLYLLGAMFEAEIVANYDKEITLPSHTLGETYRLHPDSLLTQSEKILYVKSQPLFVNLPSLMNGDKTMLYYRSYEGMKIFTSRAFKYSDISRAENFAQKMCLDKGGCQRFAFQKPNGHREISITHSQSINNEQAVITISTPVYYQNQMLGDLNIDILLDRYPLLADKQFRLQKLQRGKEALIIEEPRYFLNNIAYSQPYKIDEDFELRYRIPYGSVVTKTMWIFCLMVMGGYFIISKFEELQSKREKLLEAEIAISKDELTGLYNRAILRDASLKYAIEKKGLAIIAIDGDGLKVINDTFGHHAGDEAIVYIADTMRSCFRESDYLIRNGGDEFLVLLPGCTSVTARRLAQKLARQVGAQSFGSESIRVDISFGVSQIREHESLEMAIKRADESLYKDKRDKKEGF